MNEIYELTVCQWTSGHPRNDHQLIFPMTDGRLMLVWCEYYADSPSLVTYVPYSHRRIGDNMPCRISAKISADVGRSWSDTFTLQDNIGKMNVKHPNLLRLPSNEILFTYTVRNSVSDLRIYMKRSTDECETWSDSRQISSLSGMNFTNCDHILQLRSGRILLPAHHGVFHGRGDHYQALCYYSDDDGQTWKPSEVRMDLPKRGAEEPSIVELQDGSLLAVIRNSLGAVYKSHSDDSGESWAPPESTGLAAPASPPLLKQIPTTGDLLLIWNHNADLGHPHQGDRNPLTAAISKDEGKTWENIKDIENHLGYDSAYAAVTFVDNEALVTYYTRSAATYGESVKLKIFSIDWFYQ